MLKFVDRLATPRNWPVFYRRLFILTLPVSLPLWLLVRLIIALLLIGVVAVCVVIELIAELWEP